MAKKVSGVKRESGVHIVLTKDELELFHQVAIALDQSMTVIVRDNLHRRAVELGLEKSPDSPEALIAKLNSIANQLSVMTGAPK